MQETLAGLQSGEHDKKDRDFPFPWRFPLKRILCVLVAVFALTAIAASAADSSKINGWISDSMCGAKHSGSGANAACVKKCISGGMKPVFVDSAKKEVWAIDNPDAVKDFYGDHVIVTATADAGAKSVHIEAITAAQ
jgi:hypothetical protein